jgi:hypothetical protein
VLTETSILRRLASISSSEEPVKINLGNNLACQRSYGTEGAKLPFWSPDSRRIGFFTGGKLNTIDIAGGAVCILCDASVALGATWLAGDTIVFAGHTTGPLCRVAASGGTPVAVTPMPGQHSSQLHCWPSLLPGGDRFLYYVNRTDSEDMLCSGVHAGTLTSTEAKLISPEIDAPFSRLRTLAKLPARATPDARRRTAAGILDQLAHNTPRIEMRAIPVQEPPEAELIRPGNRVKLISMMGG